MNQESKIKNQIRDEKGFTLIELIIILAIVAIISTIVITSLNQFRKRQIPKNGVGEITSLLEHARSLTLSSKDEAMYGVQVTTNELYLFKGPVFSTSSTGNTLIPLDGLVAARPLLVGGGSKIMFDRLTGKTIQYGTIELYLVSSTTQKRIITIHQTGIIESDN